MSCAIVSRVEFLSGLNEKQKEAALHSEGPLLILAGAGAGKTKTVTHRILNLVKNGVHPHEILAITFTNKAAREMKERTLALLAKYAPEAHGTPFLATFHSLGVQILREHAEKIGLHKHFVIFDKDAQKSAVREAIKSLGHDPKQVEPGKVAAIISGEKGKMGNPEAFLRKSTKSYFGGIVAEVWRVYETILAREKAVDFDDLLLKTALLLSKNDAVRAAYEMRWKYIHIDEYQDTNTVQYEIARMLAGSKHNICVVGDADQNIYSWRGANIRNINEFEKDFPGGKIILLEENYRSTQTILSAANGIIEKNKNRRKKNLFTRNGEGEKIKLHGAYDEADEARHIAEECLSLINAGTLPEDICVLYRANFQSRALEEAFLHSGVPYQLLGVRFFDRKEVKDLLSFIRASLNPSSTADIERIINIPARGIGEKTIEKIQSGQEDSLPGSMKIKLADFRKTLSNIKEIIEKEKTSLALRKILTESGIEKMLRDMGEEGEERLENLGELVSLGAKYDELPAGEGMMRLIEDAALATDQDSLSEQKSGVKLMTVHASKGLEFEYVFIGGLEENLFPHKSFGERDATRDDEEERRLFYVALTRAKKRVYLSYASVRTIFGSAQVNIPSEFVSDIDENLIERSDEGVPARRVISYLD